MPTEEQIIELLNYTTHVCSGYNDIGGYLFTSKKNDNELFVPYAGNRYGTEINGQGVNGSIQSSTQGNIYRPSLHRIYSLTLHYTAAGLAPANHCFGSAIRPVYNK